MLYRFASGVFLIGAGVVSLQDVGYGTFLVLVAILMHMWGTDE